MDSTTPLDDFQAETYQEHNSKRFEHLDRMDLSLYGKSILEIGAGIGDHTRYLLSKIPSKILATEARQENIDIFNERYSEETIIDILQMDMDHPQQDIGNYDVCYCYGLLYHLAKPEQAIEYMAEHTRELLLLETCVDYLKQDTVNLVEEDPSFFSQSYSGIGCRPGRRWLFSVLKQNFGYVYVPRTQPDHPQFPDSWNLAQSPSRLTRAVFIASHSALSSAKLSTELLSKQNKPT